MKLVLSFLATLALAVGGLAQSNYWRIQPVHPVFTTNERAYISLTYYGSPGGFSADVFYAPVTAGLEGAAAIGNRKPIATLRPTLKPNGERKYTDDAFYVRTDKPGYYTVRGTLRGRTQTVVFTVSDLGMVVKHSARAVAAWVVNRRTGLPVAGAVVKVVAAKDQRPLSAGVTDQNGVWVSTGVSAGFAMVAVAGAHVSRVAPYYYQDYEEQASGSSTGFVYVYSERPVYRPGDTVHFKGIARDWKDGSYVEASGRSVKVVVKDEYDSEVYKGELQADSMGCFYADFQLSRNAGPSSYTIYADLGEGMFGEGRFDIAEYRKPEYRISMKTEPPVVVSGEKMVARLEARYYFGSPLANRKVHWIAYVQPEGWWSFAPGQEDETPAWGSDSEADSNEAPGYNWGETKFEGDGATDADGFFDIALPTTFPGKTFDTPVRIQVSAEMIDIAGREGDASTSGVVLPADRFAYAEIGTWIGSLNKPTVVDIVSLEAASGRAIPTAAVDYELISSRWVEDKDGKWREERATKDSGTITTGLDGTAKYSFTPNQSGTYIIRTRMTDSEGRKSVFEEHYWVYGGEDSYYWGGNAKLEVIPSQKKARTGDHITVLFKTGPSDAAVWYSIEGGTIHDQGLVRARNHMAALEFDVRHDMLPSITIWAGYMQNGVLNEGTAAISIMDPTKILAVSISPSSAKLEPGQDISYRVVTKDSSGAPVAAEFSLGVVDESIYAIRSEKADDIRDFFYGPRANGVVTTRGDNLYYEVTSGPDGAQALVANNKARRVHQKEAQDRAGEQKKVRRDFRDTAFWQAVVQTDSNGEADVKFKLPDNLTQWRATARALGLGTAVGQAVNKHVRVTKPLIASLNLPRFLVVGDEFRVIAVVRNTTEQAMTLNLKLETGEELEVSNRPEATFAVEPNGERRFDLLAKAVKAGGARVLMSVDGGGYEDAVEKDLDIQQYQNWQTDSKSGSTGSAASGSFSLPATRNEGSESLVIRLDTSLISTILGSVEALAQYPYGCVEQTTSPMIADIALLELLRKSGSRDAKLDAKLKDMVETGIQRLYRMQSYNGAWGWADYSDETGDPYWTSYVLDGLFQARAAGFDVSQDVLDKALRTLGQMMTNAEPKMPSRRAFKDKYKYEQALWEYRRALYSKVRGLTSLARSDPKMWRPALERMVGKMSDLGPSGLAMLAKGLHIVGSDNVARSVTGSLMSMAKRGKDMMYWRSDTNDTEYWFYYGEEDTYTTALALQAMVANGASKAEADSVVNWLAVNRRGSMWFSTNDTAAIARSLADYSEYTGLRPFTGKVTVKVGGFEQELEAPEGAGALTVTVPKSEIKDGANHWSLSLVGTGTLRYAVTAKYSTPNPNASPRDSGLAVTRTYHKLIQKSVTHKENNYTWTETKYELGPATGMVSPGDEIVVKLTLRADVKMRHVVLNDPLPAGLEPIDEENSQFLYYEAAFIEEKEGDRWGYGFARREQHDNRITLLIEDLPEGASPFYYIVRAVTPGLFRSAQATGEQMYQPSINGASRGGTMGVRPR